MTGMHSSRRTKGCPMCKPHKHKDQGRATRDPWRYNRLVGRKRRRSRHGVEDADS